MNKEVLLLDLKRTLIVWVLFGLIMWLGYSAPAAIQIAMVLYLSYLMLFWLSLREQVARLAKETRVHVKRFVTVAVALIYFIMIVGCIVATVIVALLAMMLGTVLGLAFVSDPNHWFFHGLAGPIVLAFIIRR